MKTKQRGSAWSIKLAFNLYKIFGYKLVYYIMYPVTFFYFIFASNVKKSLIIYYKHLDMPFTNKVYYEHLRIFAICMVDRFIAKVDPKSYTFTYDDIEEQKKILNNGSILLYSHFGGWAASSNAPIVKSKINIVMQEELLNGIKKIEENIDSSTNIHIIDLNSGMISVSVQIANALMDNETVVMMADRAANIKGEMEVNFLNGTANFNKNPFQIAYKTDKPILAYFIVLNNMQEYKVIHINITMDKTKKQEEAVMKALKEYTKKYEEVIKIYPNQWFNFYDFWEEK